MVFEGAGRVAGSRIGSGIHGAGKAGMEERSGAGMESGGEGDSLKTSSV